jgi:hypothetical protein
MKDQSPVGNLSESVGFSESSSCNEENTAHHVIGSLINSREGVVAKTAPFYIDDQEGIGAFPDATRPSASYQNQSNTS